MEHRETIGTVGYMEEGVAEVGPYLNIEVTWNGDGTIQFKGQETFSLFPEQLEEILRTQKAFKEANKKFKDIMGFFQD